MLFAISKFWGYVLIVGGVIVLSLVCYLIRRLFKIGTYTKEEEKNMKSNLDLLVKEEEIEKDHDYTKDV